MASPPPTVKNVLAELGIAADIYKVNISPREDPADRAHRQRMELVWSGFGMVVMTALFIAGIYMSLQATDAEIRKGGMGLLGAILTGVLGFLAGRATK